MKIEHIALYVKDPEGAKTFFCKYFNAAANEGYHNHTTNFRSYFLHFDDGSRLEIMHKPEILDIEKPYTHTGYSHLAFSAGSQDKVNALTEQLRKDGYQVISGPRVTGDGYYESCIVGFEGNLIEITV